MIYKDFVLNDKLGKACANQSGNFTACHVRHWLKVEITDTNTGKKYIKRTSYQFNPSATKYASGDGLLAVVSDAEAFASCPGFLDFCREFGYSCDSIKARGVFRACKNSRDFFARAGLTDGDIYELRDILDK